MKAFEAILPFLRPVEHLILDSDISEVMVNGNGLIFVEQRGCLREIEGVSIDEESLQIAVKNIARRLKDDISDERPLLNSRLPDGSRVAAVLSPVSIGGTSLTIRKFPTHVYGAEDLVGMGTMPRHMLEMLTCAIQDHKNILISGGTSSGKTTILNALASLIDPAERIVLIEDTSELRLNQRNLVRFEARRAQPPDIAAVTIRDLVKATLRHRPDRILLGEVRGGEAFDLLQALNTGHSGTLATIHANTASQAIARFVTCVLQGDVDIPFRAIRSSIGDSMNLLLQTVRWKRWRLVTELVEIEGYNQAEDTFQLKTLYRRQPAEYPKEDREVGLAISGVDGTGSGASLVP
jgi:pilus assembly protein CpaF